METCVGAVLEALWNEWGANVCEPWNGNKKGHWPAASRASADSKVHGGIKSKYDGTSQGDVLPGLMGTDNVPEQGWWGGGRHQASFLRERTAWQARKPLRKHSCVRGGVQLSVQLGPGPFCSCFPSGAEWLWKLAEERGWLHVIYLAFHLACSKGL